MPQFFFKPFSLLYTTEEELVLKWRNHETVRKWMANKKVISAKEHRFFMEAQRKSTQLSAQYFLVFKVNNPVGVINYKIVSPKFKTANVGLFVNPEMINTGVGMELGFWGAKHLFQECGLEKLLLDCEEGNLAVYKLWQFLGVRVTVQDADKYYGELSRSIFLTWPSSYRDFKHERIKLLRSENL